jgi:hypothetical protein
MRVLIAIPHYYQAAAAEEGDGRDHGSSGPNPGRRALALATCITALHQIFDSNQRIIVLADRTTRLVNAHITHQTDIVVCTTRGRHLIDRLRLPTVAYRHHPTDAEPLLLGFECHAVLRDGMARNYDYYGYMEDDLVVHDPWFFAKLAWFTTHVGDDALLQPNRYEVGPSGIVLKAYLDGDLPREMVAPFEAPGSRAAVLSDILGCRVVFQRPLNPHAGCFFLNARQMAAWAARADFLDRDTSFVGALESAATLGVSRAFRIYKPAPENAAFLEIEHDGTAFISQLRRRDDVQ